MDAETYRGGVPLAEVLRSGFVEGRHHGSVAVVDARGELAASAGDPYGQILPRSSNKPMQASAMLAAGLAPQDEAELALVAASHSGEPFHVERVRAMLRRAGLDEQALACPPDLPVSEEARAEVLRRGGGPQRVLMNCSGKHAGMLLTCRAAGWSTVDYVQPDHPLQRACRIMVEELTDEAVTAVGVDGCGAPIFATSLRGLARAFLRCVTAAPASPARRVADAMRANPELMSGTGREDARLIRAVPGLLSKSGAEGVGAVAVPGVGAVATKIDDGAARARMPVVIAALRQLGVAVEGLDDLAQTPVLGGGRPVGAVRALAVW
ncbi:MAG TPA: asparaginase [Micromonosporaceae bacterium]